MERSDRYLLCNWIDEKRENEKVVAGVVGREFGKKKETKGRSGTEWVSDLVSLIIVQRWFFFDVERGERVEGDVVNVKK